MTRHEPETPLTSQAAERIRTADPFITREIEVPPSAPNPHETGGSGRREETRTAGKDTPEDSIRTLRDPPVFEDDAEVDAFQAALRGDDDEAAWADYVRATEGLLNKMRDERDLYRRALIRIGNNESGHWGVIAREALKTAANSQEGQG